MTRQQEPMVNAGEVIQGEAPHPPYWQSSDVTLYHGDARTMWRHLPEQSVHAIVTSPPY